MGDINVLQQRWIVTEQKKELHCKRLFVLTPSRTVSCRASETPGGHNVEVQVLFKNVNFQS